MRGFPSLVGHPEITDRKILQHKSQPPTLQDRGLVVKKYNRAYPKLEREKIGTELGRTISGRRNYRQGLVETRSGKRCTATEQLECDALKEVLLLRYDLIYFFL